MNLNDGILTKVIPHGDGTLTIAYIDWQEKSKKLLFCNVVYLELLYAGLAAGSHTGDFIIKDNDDKILEVLNKIGESPTGYKLFQIFDAWGDNKLVEIIAKSVEEIEIEP